MARITLGLLSVLFLVEASFAQAPEQPVAPLPTPAAAAPNDQTLPMPNAAAQNLVTQPIVPTGGPVNYSFVPESAPGKWWGKADYIMGWLRATQVQPLVTTSPPGTPQASAGVLNQTGTAVVFDGKPLGEVRYGARAELGYWFHDDFAIAGGWFMLGPQAQRFYSKSNGDPILARPFVDTATGKPASALIAFPGLSTGSIMVTEGSQQLYGANLNFRERFYDNDGVILDAIFGYRMLHYAEDLAILSDTTTNQAPFVPGTRLQVADRFTTRNDFHGLDLGLRAELHKQRWSLELLGKVAVGNLDRHVQIDGGTISTAPGGDPISTAGGLLALSSNIGKYSRGNWVAIPEVGATVGWQMFDNLRFNLGYSVLMFSDVARAADQIDLTVNKNLIPPAAGNPLPNRPGFGMQRTDLWLQSVNLGFEYRF